MYIFARPPLAIVFASFAGRCVTAWKVLTGRTVLAGPEWRIEYDERLADMEGMIADCKRAHDEHERASVEFKVARAQYDLEKEQLRELCNLGLCELKARVEMFWARN